MHVAWCWPQPTIRYFHLTRLTKDSYQKTEKMIVKSKKKRTKREADSRYVEGVIDVEWERNGEWKREKKKSCSGKKKRKKKLSFFINIYYIWTIKNLGLFQFGGLKPLLKWLKGWTCNRNSFPTNMIIWQNN